MRAVGYSPVVPRDSLNAVEMAAANTAEWQITTKETGHKLYMKEQLS
jgi:hypothetical protein